MMKMTVMLIGLSILMTSCSSAHHIQLHSDHQQVRHDVQLPLLHTLPRKLRPLEEEPTANGLVKSEDFLLDKGKGTFPAKPYGPRVMPGEYGTMQKWVGGRDTWQFFTMDYSRVRRRRPIHNKAVPLRRP